MGRKKKYGEGRMVIANLAAVPALDMEYGGKGKGFREGQPVRSMNAPSPC